jgi:hypothetical protein
MIKCKSCGEEFESKAKLIKHILNLDCFDENLDFKEYKE